MNALLGKIAVVTGGSSGIGLAITSRFVAEGAHVYIVGRRQVELDKAKAAVGKEVTVVQGDVTSTADLDRLAQTVSSQTRAIDVIVAGAGMVERGTLESASPEHFDKTFDLNARGTFFTVQKLLPLMRDGGSIVLISSGMSCLGVPGHGAYAATKAAIRSFSRTWAAELKHRGIRANTLSPGPIETPMIDGQAKSKEQAEALRAMYVSMIPLGRLGRPEEIASAALFLASDESSFSTGIDLVADGGITQL
jgi:NAD(P)-dependent dehydrogenase (short-subunit alcohol dehydrogenase family)